MTHRTDRITLPADEERCSALANPCRDKWSCARYLALPPKYGAKMDDYSRLTPPVRADGQPACAYYRRPRPFEPQIVKPEVKPWPHD